MGGLPGFVREQIDSGLGPLLEVDAAIMAAYLEGGLENRRATPQLIRGRLVDSVKVFQVKRVIFPLTF